MKKEKIHLEYLLNATSKNILWSAISTPTGLEDWFADKVVSDDKTVTFCWGEKQECRRSEPLGLLYSRRSLRYNRGKSMNRLWRGMRHARFDTRPPLHQLS